MIQLLGFAGSSLIILSSSMRTIGRLRFVAFVGSVTFVGYGIAIQAWPVVATNIVTSIVHLYNLLSHHRASLRSIRSAYRRSGPDIIGLRAIDDRRVELVAVGASAAA